MSSWLFYLINSEFTHNYAVTLYTLEVDFLHVSDDRLTVAMPKYKSGRLSCSTSSRCQVDHDNLPESVHRVFTRPRNCIVSSQKSPLPLTFGSLFAFKIDGYWIFDAYV